MPKNRSCLPQARAFGPPLLRSDVALTGEAHTEMCAMAANDSTRTTRGRGGRPKTATPRSHRLVLHLNDAEFAAVSAAAAGRTLGSYARAVLFAPRRQVGTVPAVNLDLAVEFGRIGVNLNQLLRLAHSGVQVGMTPAEIADLIRLLHETRAAVLGRSAPEDGS